MKQLYEITSTREIEQHRNYLLRQLYKQEKQVDKDIQKINNNWQRWKTVGSAVGNLALSFMPKVNTFSLGLSLAKRLFRRKK